MHLTHLHDFPHRTIIFCKTFFFFGFIPPWGKVCWLNARIFGMADGKQSSHQLIPFQDQGEDLQDFTNSKGESPLTGMGWHGMKKACCTVVQEMGLEEDVFKAPITPRIPFLLCSGTHLFGRERSAGDVLCLLFQIYIWIFFFKFINPGHVSNSFVKFAVSCSCQLWNYLCQNCPFQIG